MAQVKTPGNFGPASPSNGAGHFQKAAKFL
jgi:hypothetical protein